MQSSTLFSSRKSFQLLQLHSEFSFHVAFLNDQSCSFSSGLKDFTENFCKEFYAHARRAGIDFVFFFSNASQQAKLNVQEGELF